MPRRGRHAAPAPTPHVATDPLAAGAYDWTRFGRHRLRAPAGVVVDVPFPTDTTSQAWVATTWPDARVAGGWARLPWQVEPVTGRGWLLPQQLAAGDVLEFSANTAAGWVRWHGVLDSYEYDRWLTVQGPYPDAAAAHDDAQRLLATERFLPALTADTHHAVEPTPCTRGRVRRRRTRE